MDSEHETKARGVIEAAQDPNNSITSHQAQKAVMQNARQAGATAFEFDPDATPEQKAAQAKALAAPHLPRPNKAAALVTDVDGLEEAGYDLPTPSKEGAITAPLTPSTANANGFISHEEAAQYAKVGWAPRFGNPADKEEVLLQEDHQTFLEGKINDKFFGDWYHNIGVIVFACLSSWVVAVLGGGLGWIFIIMAACGTYYRTSVRRVRRNFRDDITRELAKNRLETDTESLEWINSFLTKFWPIYAPVLCATIVSSVDQVLSTSTPAFLDSMRMKSFTLGTKPPRLEHVKTYPRADDDIVIMDWKFSFTPNDLSDMTAKQVKNRVQPKVVLEIRVGKAMISKGLDVIVEDMACTGTMRVKMKLQLPFPHIDRVEICFLGKPKIDYICKPLGGETLGFDMGFIPGLQSFIQEQIHANLGPMMYDPNVFPIEIAKMLAGSPVDQAIGVLQIHFHGAQGLRNPDKFSGTPDPYATVSINNREVVGKTKVVQQNASPRWNETINIIITSTREPLTIAVLDHNDYRKDKELGVAAFNLEQLEAENEWENQSLEIIANGRPRGTVSCDIRFFPVLQGQRLPNGIVEPPPESLTGIAKFTVEQAKDLDGTKSLVGQLNPYAVLLLNGREVQTSQKLKRTNNPIWPNATKEMLITDRKRAKMGLVIKDDRDLAHDPVLATYQIKLDDLLDLTNKGQEWFTLAGAKTGRAKMMLQWKPVALRGALGGNGYVDPIGVLRFHFQSGKDLKNLDTVGKSDPYARVLLSGIQKGRTVTWKNNLNPEWDEVLYVPIHSSREKLTVEVMDEENVSRDRTMGHFELSAADYLKQNENGEFEVYDTKHKVVSALLRIGNSPPKGTVNFTVAFYPTLPVVDPEEEERDKESEKARMAADNVSLRSVEKPANGNATTLTTTATAPRMTRTGTVGTISSLRPTADELEMRKALAQNEKEQTETDEVRRLEVPKVRISVDDLTDYESGLIIVTIHDGELAHSGSYLELAIDDMKYPAYTSSKTRSRIHTFNETADIMVRELDLSRITLRLVSVSNDQKGSDEHDIRAKLTGNTIDTLRKCLYKPTIVTLTDDHGHESRVKVSMRYLPVKMALDPSESFNNSGNLRVEVLDAADLPAADRNGFSDPFCRFVLNGEQVYKTNVQKKTLHPAWNEFFEVPVRSRTAAKFDVNVFDWDFGEKADYLGSASINLDVLEPFKAQEVILNLNGKSGSIRLKMLFKPDYIVRSRQGSSTFSGTFAAPGKIIGAPVKGVGKVGHAVGGGIFRGATFVGRGFKRRVVSGQEMPPDDATAELRATSMESHEAASRPSTAANVPTPIDEIPTSIEGTSTPRTPHQRQISLGAVSQSPATNGDQGTATITVLSASGYEAETKLEIHIHQEAKSGHKEIFKTKAIKNKTGEVTYPDESKRVVCSASSRFKVAVKNDKSFGRHDDLGEAVFFVNDQSDGGEQEVAVGQGTVLLRTSFQPADAGSMLGADSPAAKHNLGRFMSRRERSATPTG